MQLSANRLPGLYFSVMQREEIKSVVFASPEQISKVLFI